MFRGSGKPFTAVTVQIDRLTSEQYEVEDVAGIFDLVEVIRIQSSGPTEAARALRKKLKYGNPHRQLRSLVILDGLLENAGSRFQRTFVDEPLLERLLLLSREDITDAQVRQKCQVLFVQWANAYKNTSGLERIANLYKELPKSHRPAQARQKVLQETERYDSDGEPPTSSGNRSRAGSSATPASRSGTPVTLTPSTHRSSGFSKLSKRSKSSQGKTFNLSREKDNMTTSIAQASIASTNLLNGLQLINRETERVSGNPEVLRRFETCKDLRRKILYYIQNVESDDWIGSLVNANDELVKALTAYEITDRSIDDDSDSDAWEHLGTDTPNPPSAPTVDSNTKHLAGLKMEQEAPPVKPPRPGGLAMPPPPSFQNAQPGAQESPGDDSEDAKKQDQITVDSQEIDVELGGEGGIPLQRMRSSDASPVGTRQGENQPPRRSARYTGPEQGPPPQSQKKPWRGRGKLKEQQPEQDLSLVRTPAISAPPVPDPEEARDAEYQRYLNRNFEGQESWYQKRIRLRPVYAEDLHTFTSPVFGEENPGLRIRFKRILASTLTAIVNPKNSICRAGKFLFKNFCGCCTEDSDTSRLPKLIVRSPSDEDERKKKHRPTSSDGHDSPTGSYRRSRENFAHMKDAGEINRSRNLLKPPNDSRARAPEDDNASIDTAGAAAFPTPPDTPGSSRGAESEGRDREDEAEPLAEESNAVQTDGPAPSRSSAKHDPEEPTLHSTDEPAVVQAEASATSVSSSDRNGKENAHERIDESTTDRVEKPSVPKSSSGQDSEVHGPHPLTEEPPIEQKEGPSTPRESIDKRVRFELLSSSSSEDDVNKGDKDDDLDSDVDSEGADDDSNLPDYIKAYVGGCNE